MKTRPNMTSATFREREFDRYIQGKKFAKLLEKST